MRRSPQREGKREGGGGRGGESGRERERERAGGEREREREREREGKRELAPFRNLKCRAQKNLSDLTFRKCSYAFRNWPHMEIQYSAIYLQIVKNIHIYFTAVNVYI